MTMTNIKLKIKKGDQVIVLSGKDKGKKGEVLKIFPKTSRALVSGVNVARKHQRPTMMSAGGITEKERTIHLSNIALIDPKSGKSTRVGYKTLENGEKVRIAKRSGEAIS